MIKNGRDYLISETSTTTPNLSGPVSNWLQPLILEIVTTEIINYSTRQIKKKIETSGIIAPFTSEDLQVMPIGQREWQWFSVYLASLILKNNDKFIYRDKIFKVMSTIDYTSYGYASYTAIGDFQGGD